MVKVALVIQVKNNMIEQLSIEALDDVVETDVPTEKNVKKVAKRSVKERRQQVLTVLTHMLHSEQGMSRMTTKRLAEEVGVSEAALYRYFPSKTALFEALLENTEITLFSRIKMVTKNEMKTSARVHDILQIILDFARKNPGLTRVLTGHALMFEEAKLQARVALFFDRLEMQLLNILQMRRLREGIAFAIDEKLIATHLINFCEGQFNRFVRTNFRNTNKDNFEQQWRLLQPILV